MKRIISLLLTAVMIVGALLVLAGCGEKFCPTCGCEPHGSDKCETCGCDGKSCPICGCEKHLPSVCESCGCTKTFSDGCEFAATRSLEGRDVKYVKMTVKDYGNIIRLLDATTAPITVANFLKLTNKGFYNGLTFHRIMKGFMIQGGCPEGTGAGSTDPIVGEFYDNGYNNDLQHIRGVISMARRGDSYDSGSCQFFICNADARRSLDNQYAAFGYVLSGMSVVDTITDTCYPYANPYYNYTLTYKMLQPVIDEVVQISEKEALSYCN